MTILDNENITIPLTLIFSEPGVGIFIRKQKKLMKFTMANNKTGYGAFFAECPPSFLQKMIFNGYIWKMELTAGKNREARDRKNLISLTKLVSHTLLCRQFNNSVKKEIFSSEVIRQWNRNNPGKPIDSKTRFNNQFLSQFMFSKKNNVDDLVEKISGGVFDYFKLHPEIRENDRENIIKLSREFVSFLGSDIWFLLSLQKSSQASAELLGKVRTVLIDYLEKTIIVEYLAILLVELLVFLRPEIFRNNEENSAGEISICFVFPAKGWNYRDDRVRMEICINDSVMLQKKNIQKTISDRSNGLNQELSLKEFYEQAGENIGFAGIGLYYLSYLKDACNKMEIIFQSTVSHLPGKETEINLSMRL